MLFVASAVAGSDEPSFPPRGVAPAQAAPTRDASARRATWSRFRDHFCKSTMMKEVRRRYIEFVLEQSDYYKLSKSGKSRVERILREDTGFSRAQVTQLIRQYRETGTLKTDDVGGPSAT